MSYDTKKKVTVLDMSKYVDKSIRVKFMGGREVSPSACCGLVAPVQHSTCCYHASALSHGLFAQVVGVLKGYDALLNLVLDESHEYLKVQQLRSPSAPP